MRKEERNLYQAYMYRVNALRKRGMQPIEDFETFKKFSTSVSQATGETLLEAGKRRLRSASYLPYEEMVHKNLTTTLKKEGMTSRLYRMGGKTAFEYTRWHSKYEERDIDGAPYKSQGFYMMGDVQVRFWTAVDDSLKQYIEFVGPDGKTHLQARKGERIDV